MTPPIATISALLSKPAAFVRRDLLIAAGYRLQFATQFIGILVSTFMFFTLSKLVGQNSAPSLAPYGGDYFSFLLIGIALSDFMFVSVSTFGQEIRKAQTVGTFEAMLVTPTSIPTILFSSYLYTFFRTALRIVLYFVIGWLFFGFQAHPAYLLRFFATVIVAIMPFWGIGLLSAAFIIVFKQGSPINWLVGTFSGLLAGVMYPVAVLPGWLQPLADFIPLTHGLEAVRRVLLDGAGFADIASELIILTAFSIVLLGLGLAAVYWSLRIARRDGTLLHY